MQIKVKVGGVDLSDFVDEKSLKIESIISSQVDICDLRLDLTNERIVAKGFTPSVDEKDEVIISNMAETVRYFAGEIAKITKPVEGISKVLICRVQDYTIILSRVLANKVYEDQTDKQMITNLFSTYLPEVDTSTYVEEGVTHSRVVFNRENLYAIMNELSKLSGFDWYLDYNKKLHYFAPESNAAPFELSDTPDGSISHPYSKLRYARDATSIINMVTVVGGTYMSSNTDFELEGNAQTTELLLPYPLHKPTGESSIQVYQNDGTDETPSWTELGVGVDFIDELGGSIDVLYNYNEKLLKFDTAPPDLKRSVKVTGRYDVPILVRVRSDASHAQYGRWYESKVVDKNIDSKEWAQLVGKSVLAAYAFVRENGELVCEQDGLVAGMVIKVTNALRSIDDNYRIHRVTTTIMGGTHCQYRVSFGEHNPDLIDMLLDMRARSAQFQERREDETLLELLEHSAVLSLTGATDYHADAFPPNMSRWIAIPPTQGVGHHVRHEALALVGSTDIDSHIKNDYPWDENGEITYWDFFTWAA